MAEDHLVAQLPLQQTNAVAQLAHGLDGGTAVEDLRRQAGVLLLQVDEGE